MSVVASFFKALRGLSTNLSSKPRQDGQLLYTTDTNKLYIDSTDESSNETTKPVVRQCINPNADWLAVTGNSAILNKPINLSTSATQLGTNGIFVKSGLLCHYAMNRNYTIDSIAASSTVELDAIPDGFGPIATTNKIAIINDPQLADSLMIRFDYATNKVLIVNVASNALTNITLISSSYNYVLALANA